MSFCFGTAIFSIGQARDMFVQDPHVPRNIVEALAPFFDDLCCLAHLGPAGLFA
jgi:hypothetical protein